MAKAVWNKKILAESEDVKIIDGHYYFPMSSVEQELLRKSPTKHIDAKKGTADFYNIVDGEDVNWNAAWYYPQPKDEVREIKDHVAFASSVGIQT